MREKVAFIDSEKKKEPEKVEKNSGGTSRFGGYFCDFAEYVGDGGPRNGTDPYYRAACGSGNVPGL